MFSHFLLLFRLSQAIHFLSMIRIKASQRKNQRELFAAAQRREETPLIPIPLNKDVFFSADYGGKHLSRPTEYDISFWEWYNSHSLRLSAPRFFLAPWLAFMRFIVFHTASFYGNSDRDSEITQYATLIVRYIQ